MDRERSREKEFKTDVAFTKDREKIKKQWDTTNSFSDDQSFKFMKLMGGYKGVESQQDAKKLNKEDDEVKLIDSAVIGKYKTIDQQLENQYNRGMAMHRASGKGGLGFHG